MDGKVLIRSKQSESDTLYPFQLVFYKNEFDFYPNNTLEFESVDSAKQFIAEIYESENIDWSETTDKELRWELINHLLKSLLSILISIWNGILSLKSGVIWLWDQKIAKYIPGTKQFHNRSFWKMIELMRKKLSEFRQIEAMLKEKGENPRSILIHREAPIIQNEIVFLLIGEVSVTLLLLFIVAVYCGGSISLINNWLNIKWGFAVGIISFLALYPLMFLVVVVEAVTSFLGKFIDTSFISRVNVVVFFMFLLGYPAGFYYYSETIRLYSQNVWVSGFALGGLNFSAIFIFSFPLMAFVEALEGLSKTRLNILHPEIVFVNDVLGIISKSQDSTKKVKGLQNKQFLLTKLENLATHLEKNILYKINYQDNGTKFWAKTEVKKMSSAIREIKKLVILPDYQGREVFQEKMYHLLAAALMGAWGEFPKIEKPHEPSIFQKFSTSISFMVRTLISVVLPVIIWIIFQKSSFAIATPISDYVNIGLLIWGILSILAALDPSYSMKINSIREITQIVSPKK